MAVTKLPDLSHLVNILNSSRIATENNALYQTIFQIIQAIQQGNKIFAGALGISTTSGGGGGGSFAPADATYLTVNNELATLAQSRRLLAGTGITFDDSVAGIRTVESSSSLQDFVVMSDGANPPTPVDDGNGNFIYIPYTP